MESDREGGGYRTHHHHHQSGYHSEGGNTGYRSDTGYHSDQGGSRYHHRNDIDYKRDRAGFTRGGSTNKQVDIAGHSALNNNLPLHNPAGIRTTSHDVEVARQRALQAADYYHRTVMGGSCDDPDTSPGKEDPYFTQFNGGGDPLRAGVTPASSDAYYKAKLRAGFIDLRNSYNEKIRPRNQSGYSRGLNTPSRVGLGRVTEDSPQGREKRNGRRAGERRGLYRSNSSLELESIEQRTEEERSAQRRGLLAGGPLRRDYGSASSLDVIGANARDDANLLASLQDYRNENLGGHPSQQHHSHHAPTTHAHSVPPMREFRTGRPEQFHPDNIALSSHDKLANGGLAVEDDTDAPLSPRLKKSQKNKDKKPRNKSVVGESSGGLFKKLRGAKSDENNSSKSLESPDDLDPSVKTNDRQKRKAIVHYDCQSIGVSLYDVIRRRNSLDRRKNTTTGASAASGVRSVPGPSEGNALLGLEESDSGDGKSSDLVLACAYFRNELGGEEERSITLNRATAQKRVQQLLGNRHADTAAMRRHPACNGIAVLDTSPPPGQVIPDTTILAHKGLVIEHVDHGAFYYRSFFHSFEHQNCFGIDDNLGPVAVSIKREKLDDYSGSTNNKTEAAAGGALYLYRVIIRTSELSALRCCALEDAIPSSSRLSSTRGLPPKDVLEFVTPEVQLSALKLAVSGQKTADQLLKLDEQGITRTYKLGIMYCKAGQSTEEEMYNNEHAGPALEEFLDCIGHRVRLQGFDKYRGGLDNKTDSTGMYSLYTEFHNYEIMFHVSTMLPYTPNNRQQLLRKRHVGNDIVTIVFQEPGALPFTPKTVRSHFQHVFIVVRCHNPNTEHVRYSLAVSRSKDVPPFGPPIPDGAMFPKSADFAEFLLTKAINAENAAHKCEKFRAMATRTRQEYLKDLATNYVTTTVVDSGSKLSKFSLGSGRKKERMRIRSIPDIFARGALVWNVQVEDFGQSEVANCLLGIAAETVVLIDEITKEVIFTMPCRAVIGWTSQNNSLRIYYNRGECLAIQTVPLVDADEVAEIVSRLSVVTRGCETQEMTLRRNGMGQLGFHLHYEGIVADVEPHGFAWQSGLRQHARLVEICKVATATLTHDQMIDLLRTSVNVKVIVIAPHDDGTPRRGVEETPTHSPIAALYVDTSPSRHDDQSSASSHSTVRASHSYPSAYHRSDKESSTHSRVTATNSANYLDIRAVTANMEARGYHNSPNHPLHVKDESRDSAGSRSSGHGSLDGQGSENFAARTDTMSSEGFVSGDDRHGRHAAKENTHNKEPEWTGQVTIYPAYPTTASPPSPKPPERWARSAYLESARSAMSALSPQKSVSNTNLNMHGYGVPPEKPPRVADHVTSSATNLSDLSSSHSGNSAKHRPDRVDYSPSSRGHHAAGGSGERGSRRNLQRQYLDVSPGSNASNSPQSVTNVKRSPGPGGGVGGAGGGTASGSNSNVASSSEDLANRLRPGVSSSTKVTPTRANFQEELMRLINPDISLAELEHALNKDDPGKRWHRSPRLQRTLSDESMCSSQQHTLPRQPRSLGEAISHDVIFSSARTPSHPPGAPPGGGLSPGQPEHQLTRQQRIERLKSQWLSPRATDDAIREEAHHDLSPLPLPDAGGLDWNNLVHTATKAFTGDSEGGGGANERQMGMKNSKSDKHKTSPEQSSSPGNRQSAWRSMGDEVVPGAAGPPRVEHQFNNLAEQLQQEREERQALEMEVQRLRNDNVRLQEESQTAAAQLRRFTEWFFNTIDQK